MPASLITQTLSDLPEPPDRVNDSQEEFTLKADASLIAQTNMVDQLQTWTTQANALATQANADATAAAASYDSFDDRYLGAKSSAPSVDNDGNVLITGALYFNSTTGKMNVRTASATWVEAIAVSSDADTLDGQHGSYYRDMANANAGTLAVARGGTGLTSYSIGDIIYASTTGVLSKLADVATGNVLISGGVGVAPSYGKVGLTTHVSGTLAVGNGGTGVTSSTGTGNNVLSTSPTLVTPSIGVATGTSFNSITGLASTSPSANGTASVGTSTLVARQDHVHPTDTTRAPLASPTFTGTPLSTTPATGDNSTKIATTAFVNNEIANDAVLKGGNTGALTIGTNDANALTLETNNTARVTVDASGNVGIGDSNPTSPLTFGSSVGAKINLYSLSADNNAHMGSGVDMGFGYFEHSIYYPAAAGSKLTFGTFNGTSFSEKARINQSGNLLIGTTADNGVDKLQVNGSISATNITSKPTFVISNPVLNQWYPVTGMTNVMQANILAIFAEYGGNKLSEILAVTTAFGATSIVSIAKSGLAGYLSMCDYRWNGNQFEIRSIMSGMEAISVLIK